MLETMYAPVSIYRQEGQQLASESHLFAPEDVGDQQDQLGGLLAHPLHSGLHRVVLDGPLGSSLQG